MFSENIGIKSWSGQIVSFWPLCFPVGVTQDGPSFTSGEWWEVTPTLFLECAVKEEQIVIENVLVLFITTPKDMNKGEGETSSQCWCKSSDLWRSTWCHTYAQHSGYCMILYSHIKVLHHMWSLIDTYINLLQWVLDHYLYFPLFPILHSPYPLELSLFWIHLVLNSALAHFWVVPDPIRITLFFELLYQEYTSLSPALQTPFFIYLFSTWPPPPPHPSHNPWSLTHRSLKNFKS